MKALSLAVAVIAALVVSACGNDKEAAPLALDQRVPTGEDAAGSEPDPVEKRVTVSGPEEFISRLGDAFVNPTPKDVSEFKGAGFLRAIEDTRFIPKTPGGAHSMGLPHIFSLVMQFESEDGAKTGLEILHADSLRPCPETCAFQVTEFDVPDIPAAQGVRRYASAESIQATGDERPPRDQYEIAFADGAFAYRIELAGPPGTVSQDEAEEIAGKLYDRVRGGPAAKA